MVVPGEHANVSEILEFVDYHGLWLRRTSSHGCALSICPVGATGRMHNYALFPSSRLCWFAVQSNLPFVLKWSSPLLLAQELFFHIGHERNCVQLRFMFCTLALNNLTAMWTQIGPWAIWLAPLCWDTFGPPIGVDFVGCWSTWTMPK